MNSFWIGPIEMTIPSPDGVNHENYIVLLSQPTSWLETITEELGVGVYLGFASASIIYGNNG